MRIIQPQNQAIMEGQCESRMVRFFSKLYYKHVSRMVDRILKTYGEGNNTVNGFPPEKYINEKK